MSLQGGGDQTPRGGGSEVGRIEVQGSRTGSGTVMHQHYSGPSNPTFFVFQQSGNYTVSLHTGAVGSDQTPPYQQIGSSPRVQTPSTVTSPFTFTGFPWPTAPPTRSPQFSMQPRQNFPGN